MGSSPLTRGKHDARLAGEVLEGLIPAHAGKTGRDGASDPREPAHPRSRGENHGTYYGTSGVPGSSPLTRGKRVAPPAPPISPRLIPAHAGKTQTWQ